MKRLLFALATLVSINFAHAQNFIIPFTATSGDSASFADVDVQNGIAISGTLTITKGPGVGSYDLLPLTGGGGSVQTFTIGNLNISFDDVVNPGSDPFLSDTGLAFENGDGTIAFKLNDHDGNPGYYDFTYLNSTVVDDGYQSFGGSASISPAPEPTTYALMLVGVGALAIVRLRRLAS